MPSKSTSRKSKGGKENERSSFPAVPKNCVVTGGTGFVGRRLVEMLVERGAEKVVAFDISPKPSDVVDDDDNDAKKDSKRIVWMQGDLRKLSDVKKAIKGADCV